MIKAKDVNARRIDADRVKVKWEIDDTTSNVLEYAFYILRSESPEGPWETIAGPLTDQYEVYDATAPLRSGARNLYYSVRTRHIQSQKTFNTFPVTTSPRPPLDALEIIRRNDLLFREFTGRPCILYPVRTFGQRCTDCFDVTTSRRTTSSCNTCWNTGFMRGYHTPVVVYVQIDPIGNPLQHIPPAMTDSKTTGARMGVYPLLKPRDILVESENKRWRVAAVNHTERLRAPVRQELTLTTIPNSDVEYNIPVEWPNMETSPRSYSYRTDIQ